MRPRIVIVTYNWPPRNAMGTHRPYSWARHWSEAGAKITALTAEKQPFDAPLDLHKPALKGVELIAISYGGVVGLAGALLGSDRIRRIARNVKGWLRRRNATRISLDLRAAWRQAARPEALRLAREADIVVSTYGPAAAHLIASDMKAANLGSSS